MLTAHKPSANPYLSGAIAPLFLKTAAPIVLLMLISGLFTVADAIFLGFYVGPRALAGVTLVFPLFMALNALATLVASGMASILARRLGAGDRVGAQSAMQSATALAMVCSVALMVFYLAAGAPLIRWFSGGDAALANMASTYIGILIFGSPFQFLISIQGDTLRSEGRPGTMAFIGVLVTLANIAFNFIFIALLGWGVAGSAFGTLAAQLLALVAVVFLRLSGSTEMRLFQRTGKPLTEAWGRVLALGLPQSLSLIGISISTGCILVSVKVWFGNNYDVIIAAYGIASRLLTFAFLPLMGLNFACQSIVGNNFGAAIYHRSNRTLVVGLLSGLFYGLAVQALFHLAATPIAALFVDDPETIVAAAHIVRMVTFAYVVVAPVMVLSGYFQAIGKAVSAGILSLGRTYLFNLPLIFTLPWFFGREGIWMAAPTSDIAMLVLVAAVLHQHATTSRTRWGLFHRDIASA